MKNAEAEAAVAAELTALCTQLPTLTVKVEISEAGWGALLTLDQVRTVKWGARKPDPSGLREALLAEGLHSLRADLAAWRAGRPLAERISAPVVIEPLLAAIIVHECVGHTSEADNVAAYGHRVGISLGDRWTRLPLAVTDDPSQPGHSGSYLVDDEGVTPTRVTLVEDGYWTGLLTSQKHSPGTGSNGHGRRASGADEVLPRMSVLTVGPGDHDTADLVGSVSDGFLLGGAAGGGSVREFAQLKPAWARRIRHGRLTDEIYTDLVLRGHKVKIMRRLRGVGRQVVISDPYHRCEKNGQEVPVSLGAPHLLFHDLMLYPDGRTH